MSLLLTLNVFHLFFWFLTLFANHGYLSTLTASSYTVFEILTELSCDKNDFIKKEYSCLRYISTWKNKNFLKRNIDCATGSILKSLLVIN